jgi:hypothetical protein
MHAGGEIEVPGGVRFCGSRLREVSYPRAKGSLIIQASIAERILERTEGLMGENGQWTAWRKWFAFFDHSASHTLLHGSRCKCRYSQHFPLPPGARYKPGVWLNVSSHSYDGKNPSIQPSMAIGAIQLAALAQVGLFGLVSRYEWQLVFGYDHCASVAVPVERDALPDLVRLRDVPDGKRRRAALAHFVAAHHRRGRSQAPTEDPAIWVRKHMRGERVFRWDGLTCEIRPPAYDVERLRQAAE